MQRVDQQFQGDDDFVPVYCVECRQHISRSWSNANEGLCIDCLKAADGPTQSSPPLHAQDQSPLKSAALIGVGLASLVLCGLGSWVVSRTGEVFERVAHKIDGISVPAEEQAVIGEPQYSVTAKKLSELYDSNEVSADQQYNGKITAITGKITSVESAPLLVRLEGSGLGVSVACEFTPDWRVKLASLKAGQDVRIIGSVKGKANPFTVRLVRCRLDP